MNPSVSALHLTRLVHLGASYIAVVSTVATVETGTQLSFLGRPFKMRTLKTAVTKRSGQRLTYRGVSYTA